MRNCLFLLLTTLVLTACGGDAIAAGEETSAAGGVERPAVADSPPARSSQTKDLTTSCHFAARQLRVTCTVSGHTDGTRLFWWTDSEQSEAEGAKFDFTVTNPVPNLIVSLEECNNGSCQTVTTTLDTTQAAGTVVIQPGQLVQIPMAPAINPDGSPKRPVQSKQETTAPTGPQGAPPPAGQPPTGPPALNPQLEECLRGVLSLEAFKAIFATGSRGPSEAESSPVDNCFQNHGPGGSAGQPAPQESGGQQGPNQQQADTRDAAGTQSTSIYGTDLTGCSNDVKSFDSPPVPLEKLVHIEPMGKMAGKGGHITPTDHLYIKAISTGPNSVPVLAIADGYLVQIGEQSGGGDPLDFRVVIEHSCSLFSWYIHLETFSKSVLQQITLNQNGSWFGRVPVKSGETIGYVGYLHPEQKGFGQETDDFDWAVSDTNTLLKGFIIPDHYKAESWKVHMVDPFDYYADPLKSALIEKVLGDIAPAGGKIDFDIDGRLVGNWFLDGTRDYAATGLIEINQSDWPGILGMDPGECTTPYWDDELKRDIGNTPCTYWLGHAVFAYDYLVPDMVLISLGLHHDGKGGLQTPWMVLGNSPNPADVSVDTGVIKFELVDSGLGEGDLSRSGVPSGSDVLPVGTLLVQMLDERSVKTELFVGIRADKVNVFTENARIYRR